MRTNRQQARLMGDGFDVTRNELGRVPLPPETKTYEVIPHQRLADAVVWALPRHGYQLQREAWLLAAKGQRAFGVLDVTNGAPAGDDWGLSIGVRNSYDKQVAAGLCGGQRVVVCSNLCFYGDVEVRRRHTPGAWKDVVQQIDELFEGLKPVFVRMRGEVEELKDRKLPPAMRDRVLLEAFRRGILPTAKALRTAIDEVEHPTFPEFRDGGSAWSVLNGITFALKRHPAHVQAATMDLVRFMRNEVLAT